MFALAYVERTARTYDRKDSTFFQIYTLHLGLQALATFMALVASTYLQDSWMFELGTNFLWIFGTAGIAIATVFISRCFRGVDHEAA